MPAPTAVALGVCSDGVVISERQDNPFLVSDCVALLEARDALIGIARPAPSAEAALNWRAGVSIFEWDGVLVEGSPYRVRGLNLSGAGLAGEIPPVLGSLTELETLDLSDNNLGRNLPPALGRLSNLAVARFSGNLLTGEIPPELGSLSALLQLSFGSNFLTGGVPPELGQLSNLWHLGLSHNRLSGEIPPELGNLAELKTLELDGNQLTGCIPEQLRRVEVGTGLKYCVEAAVEDVEQPLPDSCFNGVVVPDPERNPGLVNDCEVLLATIDALSRNSALDWDTGLPIAEWEGVAVGGSTARVQELDLSLRGLEGPIPPEWGQLTGLRKLDLADNGLTGEIPDGWAYWRAWTPSGSQPTN